MTLIGAVFFESPTDAALIGDPAHPDLIEPMLDWAEMRYRAKGSDQPLMIEAMESNVARCDLLKSRGYTLFPGYFIHRHKPLDPGVIEPVNLPPGFSIRSIETEDDRRQYPNAVHSVFKRSATIEQDEFLKHAPSYTPELQPAGVVGSTRDRRVLHGMDRPRQPLRGVRAGGHGAAFSKARIGIGVVGLRAQSLARNGLSVSHSAIVEHVRRRE